MTKKDDAATAEKTKDDYLAEASTLAERIAALETRCAMYDKMLAHAFGKPWMDQIAAAE